LIGSRARKIAVLRRVARASPPLETAGSGRWQEATATGEKEIKPVRDARVQIAKQDRQNHGSYTCDRSLTPQPR
jgi:hypothetical protein